jgi:hypothetical protein
VAPILPPFVLLVFLGPQSRSRDNEDVVVSTV